MRKEAKDKIKALKLEIKTYQKEGKDICVKRDKLEKELREWQKKESEAQHQIDEIEAEEFRHEARLGKHKIVKTSELPELIYREWGKIRQKIHDGCYGDEYDGCRGCQHNCDLEAKEAFMKIYGIEQIKYG